MGNAKVDRRKVYELWWEYLQQSTSYEKWIDTYGSKFQKVKEEVDKGSLTKLSEEFCDQAYAPWIALYNRFGNVHENSFESWWKDFKNLLDQELIEDYASLVGFDIGHSLTHCWVEFRNRSAQLDLSRLDCIMESFKEHFVKELKQSPWLYLKVNPMADIKDLTKVFREIVLKSKKTKAQKLDVYAPFKYPSPTPLQMDVLKRALTVWKLKRKDKGMSKDKRMSWKEIMLKVDPQYASRRTRKGENIADSVRVLGNNYLKIAKQVIENAERGIFPLYRP